MYSQSSGLLRTALYEKLLEDMKSGKLEPGKLVSIKKIADELGTSKTPLREALLQLQVEGFVTIFPQRGIAINILSHEEKKHIFEVCGALEYQAILSVFDKVTEKHLAEMTVYNQQIMELDKSKRYDDCNALNSSFHNVYMNLCPNPYLKYLLEMNRTRLFVFTDRVWGDAYIQANYNDHKTIINLFRCGTAQELAEFVRDVHWEYLWDEE